MWNEERYEWVRLPAWWIQGHESSLVDCQLRNFSVADKGASIASLMLYIGLCMRASQSPSEEFPAGVARLTYGDIGDMCGLSRAMIRAGIVKLEQLHLIKVVPYRKQNVYQILRHNHRPWAKLPKKHLYGGGGKGEIGVFLRHFHVRSKHELNALKLYLLLLAYRDNESNTTLLNYQLIESYGGINKNDIKTAISFLLLHKFIQLDKVPREHGEGRVNQYQILGLSHLHAGNRASE